MPNDAPTLDELITACEHDSWITGNPYYRALAAHLRRLRALDAAAAKMRELHEADRDGMCRSCRGWAGEPTESPCATIRALDAGGGA